METGGCLEYLSQALSISKTAKYGFLTSRLRGGLGSDLNRFVR